MCLHGTKYERASRRFQPTAAGLSARLLFQFPQRYRVGVRSRLFLLAIAAIACRAGPSRPERRDSVTATGRAIEEAPVIREATVVAFWLPASDTLKSGQGADLLDDFRAYTGAVSPLLDQQGIKLETTTADSIVVVLENGPSRVIRLSGLDYPFGYVLVEPGYPETILTGVSTDDELLEQVSWYFGLDEEADSAEAGVVRTSVSEHFPHPRRQEGRGEGLLQEGGVGQEAAVLENRVVRVAGYVQDREAR